MIPQQTGNSAGPSMPDVMSEVMTNELHIKDINMG